MKRLYLAALILILAPHVATATVPVKMTWNVKSSSKLGIFDPSTVPPTNVQDALVELKDAQLGIPQAPLGLIEATSDLGVVNPDALGLGVSAETNVQWKHSEDLPTESHSFYPIHVVITDPPTGDEGSMKTGTVKFFNVAKGFSFTTQTRLPGGPDVGLTYTGAIGPTQTGLTFSDVQINQPVPIDPAANSIFDLIPILHRGSVGVVDTTVPLFSITITGQTVPEPSTLVLAIIGVGGLARFAKSRRCR